MSKGKKVNFTASAQGLGRQAPRRLTCCNYGNRSKKAGTTGSTETMCQLGGHLAQASHPPAQAQEAEAAPNAIGPARTLHAGQTFKPLLLKSPTQAPMWPQPVTSLTRSRRGGSSTLPRGLDGRKKDRNHRTGFSESPQQRKCHFRES